MRIADKLSKQCRIERILFPEFVESVGFAEPTKQRSVSSLANFIADARLEQARSASVLA